MSANPEGVTGSSSWASVRLIEVVTGQRKRIEATMMPRQDGQCLIYPGKTHSFHGESESGKSLLLQAECARLVRSGRRVLYLDFEDDEVSVANRLLQFGAEQDDVVQRFDYRRPTSHPYSSENREAWENMLAERYDLCVLDGVTNCLSLFGHKSIDNDDVSAWQREVPNTIVERTGAAVAMIDHVTKGRSNGRFAVGGQQKMNGLTGAAYIVEVLDGPLAPGRRALIGLRVGKDRPGAVRSTSGQQFHKTDRTQLASVVLVDSESDPEETSVTFQRFDAATKLGADDGKPWAPSRLMQRISKAIEDSDEPLSKTAACTLIGGNKQNALRAFEFLKAAKTEDGHPHLEETKHGTRTFYRVLLPYREDGNPLGRKDNPEIGS